MMILIGVSIGLGASVIVNKVSDWIEDRYMEIYTEEIINELENEEIQKLIETQQ